MMQGNRSKRARTALALGLSVAAFGATPAAQAAAPVVFCMQTYGHEIPASTCDPNPNQLTPTDYSGKVYPTSLLHIDSLGPQGSFVTAPMGAIVVEGNATPGSTVAITVTDGVKTLGPIFARAEGSSTPSARAGDFIAEVMVSELGGHAATPGLDANATGDDELGQTLLTVTARATNGSGTGAPLTDTIVKHAATAGDAYAPKLSAQKWPPIDMDHACTERNQGDVLVATGFFGYTGEAPPCTYYPISGTINDFYNGSAGTASEISDVRIEITKGDDTYLDIRHSTDSARLPAGRGPVLTRMASNVSKYSHILNINDLPPNDLALIGLDDFYVITVTVCDAWGDVMAPSTNCVVSSQGDIVVHSY